jgi:cell division protein FtsL
MIPFAALLGNPKMLMMGVAAIAIAGYIGWLKFDIWGLENDIEKLEVHVTQLEADVLYAQNETAQCLIKIDETNSRIVDLKESTEHRSEILDLLKDNIDTVREITDAKVADINALVTPENCAEAMELLRQGVK